jgi:hypothetical protein
MIPDQAGQVRITHKKISIQVVVVLPKNNFTAAKIPQKTYAT